MSKFWAAGGSDESSSSSSSSDDSSSSSDSSIAAGGVGGGAGKGGGDNRWVMDSDSGEFDLFASLFACLFVCWSGVVLLGVRGSLHGLVLAENELVHEHEKLRVIQRECDRGARHDDDHPINVCSNR